MGTGIRYSRLLLSLIVLLLTGRFFASENSDTALIRQHLAAITKTGQFRTHRNVGQLNQTAGYIRSVFGRYADTVFFQEYTVKGTVYKNVICAFGTENPERIVVGAHYDVCGDQEGADDNASGVTGLLELARLLKGQKLDKRIDLVAYSLEEPPFFRTEHMGSFIHARSMVAEKADVYGMISLEMIGYFDDRKRSQNYPAGVLTLFYGNRGNYITLVKKYRPGKFARKFCRKFKAARTVKTRKFTGPPVLPGIDFSDHLNYWKYGYSALMITDTSFYRNKNYHTQGDKMETLDIQRMAHVIDGVFKALLSL